MGFTFINVILYNNINTLILKASTPNQLFSFFFDNWIPLITEKKTLILEVIIQHLRYTIMALFSSLLSIQLFLQGVWAFVAMMNNRFDAQSYILGVHRQDEPFDQSLRKYRLINLVHKSRFYRRLSNKKRQTTLGCPFLYKLFLVILNSAFTLLFGNFNFCIHSRKNLIRWIAN
jgi:hypothetical protein